MTRPPPDLREAARENLRRHPVDPELHRRNAALLREIAATPIPEEQRQAS